jgi:hypothetical protein
MGNPITQRQVASATVATVRTSATTAPRGFRGLGPRSKHDE